jgi:hypothetical protein
MYRYTKIGRPLLGPWLKACQLDSSTSHFCCFDIIAGAGFPWGGAWGSLTTIPTLLFQHCYSNITIPTLPFQHYHSNINITIPTLPLLFEMAEPACSPFCYVLPFVYKVYIGFVCVTGQLL